MPKICLNLGCGGDIKKSTEGKHWINIDIRKLPNIDRVMDCGKLDYENVDEIRAIDLPEHFSYGEIPFVLSNWACSLKKGGVLKMLTPDLFEVIRLWNEGIIDDFNVVRLIFGNQDYPENFHKGVLPLSLWRKYLSLAGFSIKRISPIGGNIYIEAIK